MPSPTLFAPFSEGDLSRFAVTVSELDDTNSIALGEQIGGLLDQCKQNVEIDLGAVEYICSTAIAKILSWHRKLTGRQGKLSLKNAKPFVYEVLSVTGLGRLMEIQPEGSREVA